MKDDGYNVKEKLSNDLSVTSRSGKGRLTDSALLGVGGAVENDIPDDEPMQAWFNKRHS